MLCLSGNSPCLNGGACTDGVGSYTCACAAEFCGPTCADPAQSNGQCPCADDPAWVTNDQEAFTCSAFNDNRQYCSQAADAAGVTASEACPIACQSPCALTYDDCCELSPLSPSVHALFIRVSHSLPGGVLTLITNLHASLYSIIIHSLSVLSHVSRSLLPLSCSP